MSFSNLDFDNSKIEKALSLLNSPSGEEIKNKLQKLDKSEIMKLIGEFNVDERDLSILREKIQKFLNNQS